MISSKALVWSPISSKGPYFYITQLPISLDWIVQIKFGLRLDIPSDLVDQTEFWSLKKNQVIIEDKTERLSSLEKFMQIRTKTEVPSKNYDLFYQVTQCLQWNMTFHNSLYWRAASLSS